VKILLAELGHKSAKDALLTIDYDGTFEETTGCAVLAATAAVETEMTGYIRQEFAPNLSLSQALALSLRAWALGSRSQKQATADSERGSDKDSPEPKPASADPVALVACLKESIAGKSIECAVLDRGQQGTSKYRILTSDELDRLLPADLKAVLAS
jgi:proteasome alpha subunit